MAFPAWGKLSGVHGAIRQLRPILRAVIDAQDFDGVRFDAIDEDEGGNHKLAGACYSAAPSAIGHGLKRHAAIEEGLGDFPDRGRVILPDAASNTGEVVVCVVQLTRIRTAKCARRSTTRPQRRQNRLGRPQRRRASPPQRNAHHHREGG
jgi:hypothetical protein